MKFKLLIVFGLVLQSLAGSGAFSAPSLDHACQAISDRKLKNASKKCKKLLQAKEAGKHVGEYVSIRFCVDNVHECRKGHVYLNESKNYKDCFAVVIPALNRKDFPLTVIKEYAGKNILVKGKIEIYGGTPKIILDDPLQISLQTAED